MPKVLDPEEDAKLIAYFREGLTVEDIARVEQLSFHTVKSRVKRLYDKYGVRNRAQLIASYTENQRAVSVRDELVARQLSNLLTQWLGTRRSDNAVADALTLAFDVRTAPPTQTRLRLRRWMDADRDRLIALLMTLAALVPLDQSPESALRWLLDRQMTVSGPARDTRTSGRSVR